MESLLAQLGITSGAGVLLFFIMQKMLDHKEKQIDKKNAENQELQNEATKHRKEERDAQIQHFKSEMETKIDAQKQKVEALEKAVEKHVEKNEDMEKTIFAKLDNMSDTLSEIKGYMRGKNEGVKK
ncbi:MAG: hypothetical protein LBC64_01940 [Fibromonadaceae bacterium]|jgi:uncharacterized membrane protein YhiD involved in acid resistance|nr:hypothetical protein [Fibromonadaceae bacterium]